MNTVALNPPPHRNKAFATLLAFVLGMLGAHRFYLHGMRDRWGWLHLAALPTSALLRLVWPQTDWFYQLLPLIVSALAGFLEALVLGLAPDEKWDARHNAGSGRASDTGWPLAVVLVATVMIGAGVLIATMARLFDLLYTGGSYG